MADRFGILQDADGNNFYPVAGGMPSGSVTTAMIEDGAVTTAKIASGAVTIGKTNIAQYLSGTTESYTIATSDWSSLASSSPYTYSTTVTATTTIGNNTIVHLLNDQPVLFSTYGFAVGSVSGQNVTIYSIGQPSSSVTLKINYKETV